MKGILVRIGIDSTYGKWNAPVDPDTLEYYYLPIPENQKHQSKQGMERPYTQIYIFRESLKLATCIWTRILIF